MIHVALGETTPATFVAIERTAYNRTKHIRLAPAATYHHVRIDVEVN